MKHSIVVLVVVSGPLLAQEFDVPSSFDASKNALDDHVYFDHRITLYCGCNYTSHGDSDGSGNASATDCDIPVKPNNQNSATRIEWEHVVPASLMPARQFSCWDDRAQFAQCGGTGRQCCERLSFSAQAMMWDMHNLAPSFGQINQYRQNGRYGEVTTPDDEWGSCPIKDTGGTGQSESFLFEPADCTKGDLARVWLYMHQVHGILVSDEELQMFQEWSDQDPVSPWERTRHDRIMAVQGNANPFVDGVAPSRSGACPCE